MLITFTDFGVVGPYLGQMRLALAQAAPMVPVVDLPMILKPSARYPNYTKTPM